MKTKTKLLTVALAAALLGASAGCKTSPPKPPVCDGKAKHPINGRTLTGYVEAKGADDGCGRS